VAGVVGAVQDAAGAAESTRGAAEVAEVAQDMKLGGTAGATRCVSVEAEVAMHGTVRGAAFGGAESCELGTSWSVAVCGAVGPARMGVPMGGTIGVSSESKKNPNCQLDGARQRGKKLPYQRQRVGRSRGD
jgi:hypothetical protein